MNNEHQAAAILCELTPYLAAIHGAISRELQEHGLDEFLADRRGQEMSDRILAVALAHSHRDLQTAIPPRRQVTDAMAAAAASEWGRTQGSWRDAIAAAMAAGDGATT